jgi:glutathione peroxidase
MMSVYDFSVKMPGGANEAMAAHAGKVLLIVNTASKCGFTPQYKGLEALYRRYQDQGLEILAFPCNQFGAQEPGSAEDIRQFCSLTYPVSFPLFAKVEVNGPNTHPVYGFLKAGATGVLGTEAVKWNFTKFLVAKDGRVVERYAPTTTPAALKADIDKLLAE